MDLTQINIWLDVIFAIAFCAIVGVLGLHLFGNWRTGRLFKKYKQGKWPDHTKPPSTPRWLHGIHLICIFLLVYSGMYIHFPNIVPAWDGARLFMRWVHYIAMTVVMINLIWRLWYAFLSSRRDYREFTPTKMDIITIGQVIKYYTFLGKAKPHLDKYNIMQKGTYLIMLPLLIVQAFTGLALMTQTIPLIGLSPRELLLGWWLAPLLGSIDLAGWWCRTAHYAINWVFIILVTAHIYMAFTEDFPGFLEFFGGERWMGMPKDLREDWKKGYRHNHYDDAHPEDDHGHGGGHDDGHAEDSHAALAEEPSEAVTSEPTADDFLANPWDAPRH